MAKKTTSIMKHNSQPHRRTSIGKSANSRVIHKSKSRAHSSYRGQGK